MPHQDLAGTNIELLRSTLVLILRTLQMWPQHGQGISWAIRANSGEQGYRPASSICWIAGAIPPFPLSKDSFTSSYMPGGGPAT